MAVEIRLLLQLNRNQRLGESQIRPHRTGPRKRLPLTSSQAQCNSRESRPSRAGIRAWPIQGMGPLSRARWWRRLWRKVAKRLIHRQCAAIPITRIKLARSNQAKIHRKITVATSRQILCSQDSLRCALRTLKLVRRSPSCHQPGHPMGQIWAGSPLASLTDSARIARATRSTWLTNQYMWRTRQR